MKRATMSIFAGLVLFLGFCLSGLAQTPQAGTTTTQTSGPAPDVGTVVPRLVQFNGTVADASGKAATGNVAITFSLYALQEGGAPLWSEAQTLALDSQGQYTAMLVAASPEGLPHDLFISGATAGRGSGPAGPWRKPLCCWWVSLML